MATSVTGLGDGPSVVVSAAKDTVHLATNGPPVVRLLLASAAGIEAVGIAAGATAAGPIVASTIGEIGTGLTPGTPVGVGYIVSGLQFGYEQGKDAKSGYYDPFIDWLYCLLYPEDPICCEGGSSDCCKGK